MRVPQFEYMKEVADANLVRFMKMGNAAAGNNGPYGQIDSPVRNSASYLISYSYLYKITGNTKYLDACNVLFSYIKRMQSESVSGAIKCMEEDAFDYLNGLIGQAWVIDALLSFYDASKDEDAIQIAKSIMNSQQYDFNTHLWHRIELDGTDIGIDYAYNHQVYFAASASRLLDYCYEKETDEIIKDFLILGSKRDFRISRSGRLKHFVNVPMQSSFNKKAVDFIKRGIKLMLYPFRSLNLKKIDLGYQERGYQIFDLYGFKLLEGRYGHLPLFTSQKYKKAKEYALDLDAMNRRLGVNQSGRSGELNIYGYPYNSPAFEYPYVAGAERCSPEILDQLYQIQVEYMYDSNTRQFSKNNPDIETFNARTYEIIRFLDESGITERLING